MVNTAPERGINDYVPCIQLLASSGFRANFVAIHTCSQCLFHQVWVGRGQLLPGVMSSVLWASKRARELRGATWASCISLTGQVPRCVAARALRLLCPAQRRGSKFAGRISPSLHQLHLCQKPKDVDLQRSLLAKGSNEWQTGSRTGILMAG